MSDGLFAAFVVIFVLVVGGGIFLTETTADEDAWVKTEDPACYLHTVNVNRLFGTDTVTRTRYCEVPS